MASCSGQAHARSAVATAQGIIALGEGVEQAGNEIVRYAAAGVGHLDQQAVPFMPRQKPDRAVIGELDGVRDQMTQGAAQTPGVAEHAAAGL